VAVAPAPSTNGAFTNPIVLSFDLKTTDDDGGYCKFYIDAVVNAFSTANSTAVGITTATPPTAWHIQGGSANTDLDDVTGTGTGGAVLLSIDVVDPDPDPDNVDIDVGSNF
jgi:hypothetical protein